VAAKFSWDAIGARMENEYRAILNDSHRSG
jgi:hypothetical protein